MDCHNNLVCRNLVLRVFIVVPGCQGWGGHLSLGDFPVSLSLGAVSCTSDVKGKPTQSSSLSGRAGEKEHLLYPSAGLEDSVWMSAKLVLAALLTSAEPWSQQALVSCMVIN